MLEPIELFRPLATVAQFLWRVVLWLAWDFALHMVAWSVGWCVCRALTFGQLPYAKIGDLEDASWSITVFIELLGVTTIFAVAYLLMS
jgi:hypothetical protein